MEYGFDDIILADRVRLREQVHKSFVQNIELRTEYGYPAFQLTADNIIPVYCSTINKHTCVESIDGIPDKVFLVLDEHHLELLGALNRLFYLYGHNDIKQPIYELLLDTICKTPKKRLFSTLSQILAETSLLEGNATKALSYLSEIKANRISDDDYSGKEGEFDFNLSLLKDRHAEIAHSLVLNFYVFHELAHIKFSCEKSIFDGYRALVEEIVTLIHYASENSMFIDLDDISIEEISCDAYALDLLFDFMFTQSGDYQVERMVDSYICATTNMTILNSILPNKQPENRYLKSWYRIILALNTVIMLKPELLKSIHGSMEYGYMKYRNYIQIIQHATSTLINKHGTIEEKYPPFSDEWNDERNCVLSFLAALT